MFKGVRSGLILQFCTLTPFLDLWPWTSVISLCLSFLIFKTRMLTLVAIKIRWHNLCQAHCTCMAHVNFSTSIYHYYLLRFLIPTPTPLPPEEEIIVLDWYRDLSPQYCLGCGWSLGCALRIPTPKPFSSYHSSDTLAVDWASSSKPILSFFSSFPPWSFSHLASHPFESYLAQQFVLEGNTKQQVSCGAA